MRRIEKIKVLQIIPSFGVGGAEKLVLDYLTYFDKDKIDIRAISLYGDKNTHYNKSIKEKGLNVYYLEKKPGLDLSMIKKIKKIIDEFDPDIIHSHLYCIKYLLYSILNKKNMKLFHTIHNEPQKDAKGIDKFVNKIAFKWFGFTPIALTSELASDVNMYYDISHSAVINNGINLERFKKVKLSNLEAKQRLGISDKSFVVGHIGRFFKQKNHEFIIDVFNELLKKNQDSYLVLVGDGELRHIIERKVEQLGIGSYVKFLGIREDIPEIIKAMDVFLFPSIHEGFPITLIEAQATGVKCVISSAIDQSSVLSENTVNIALKDSIDRWCEVVLDSKVKNTNFKNIDEYDIFKVIEKLINIYTKSERR